MNLPKVFLNRMKEQLGEEFPSFLESYGLPPVRGLRVNTLKLEPGEFLSVCPWELEENPLLEEGFILRGAEGVGRHPYHIAGAFYMQEPSAMSAIAASGAGPGGLRVLDMCAAPGGKAGGAAARMQGSGLLVANEIVPKRAQLLARNLERLGAVNACVTCERPDRIAGALPGFFDIVTVDAPCSGEGMFRKDPAAVDEWSPEHVSACAQRQRLILESAAECTAEGGAIVYSTCTFSPEENERVIEDFLNAHAEFSQEFSERLYPHRIVGEGHFVCRLRKAGSGRSSAVPTICGINRGPVKELAERTFSEIVEGGLQGVLFEQNGRVRMLPQGVPEALLKLRPVSLGTELGEIRKGRLEPSHSFFMAAHGRKYLRELVFDPDDPLITEFLSGNTLPCPEEWRGFAAVSVRAGAKTLPIGFGKAVQGVLKNRLPKGLYVNNSERNA